MTRRGAQWKVIREDAMSHIKQAIRNDLEATGMTQKDLAAYCGLTEKHVSQMLTGRVAGTFDTLAGMAAACGLAITVKKRQPVATEALDQWFPPRGPCGVCGGPDARHRVIDAIREHVAAGETPQDVAAEMDLPVEAVLVALEAGDEV